MDEARPPDNDAERRTLLFDGREVGTEDLFPLVYNDLRRLAATVFRRENPAQTLQPTALVNEAYLRLVDQRTSWKHRAGFFAVAAQCMRRVLVDQARARKALKRGGDRPRVTLLDPSDAEASLELDVLDLDEALQRLEKVSERLVQVIELRFFAGLSLEETAQVMGVSRTIVVRQWAKARTVLADHLGAG